MFVVLQCFNNLPEEQTLGRSLKDRIAVTMQHAGVAITVTSVTDVLAFGVGAITVCARASEVSPLPSFHIARGHKRLKSLRSKKTRDMENVLKYFFLHFPSSWKML